MVRISDLRYALIFLGNLLGELLTHCNQPHLIPCSFNAFAYTGVNSEVYFILVPTEA